MLLCNLSLATYFYLFLGKIPGKNFVGETRKYAEQLIRAAGDAVSLHSRARRWNRFAFGISHLKKFIGISLLMGILLIKDVKIFFSFCTMKHLFISVFIQRLVSFLVVL